MACGEDKQLVEDVKQLVFFMGLPFGFALTFFVGVLAVVFVDDTNIGVVLLMFGALVSPFLFILGYPQMEGRKKRAWIGWAAISLANLAIIIAYRLIAMWGTR